MTPDYRVLCAELIEAVLFDNSHIDCMQIARRARALLNQPPALADVNYEWELQDAAGEWQAGGSANSLDDVRREGTRYLQTYAQDGPHKLIISQHTTQTIDEMPNG